MATIPSNINTTILPQAITSNWSPSLGAAPIGASNQILINGTSGHTSWAPYNYNILNPTINYHTDKLEIIDSKGNSIVTLTDAGEVIWNNNIQVNEATEAFGKSFHLGAEFAAGIKESMKLSVRDSVFKDLISIAKEKGSLTAEDLTYLLEASKIVEKLKNI